jgi:hypothetical protein
MSSCRVCLKGITMLRAAPEGCTGAHCQLGPLLWSSPASSYPLPLLLNPGGLTSPLPFTLTGLTPQSPMTTLQSQRRASGPQRLHPFPFTGALLTAKGVKTLYPTSCSGSTAHYPRSFHFRSLAALLPRHDLTSWHLQQARFNLRPSRT